MPFFLLPVDFVVWYFTQLPKRLLHFFINITLFLENSWAIRLHLRLFFTPLFHDTTIVGRLLSVWFRSVRVFGGSFALFAIDFLIAPILLLWLAIPFLPLFSRPTIILWPIVFIYYCLFIFGRPKKKVFEVGDSKQAVQATSRSTKKLFGLFVKSPNVFLTTFAHSADGQLFFAKLGTNSQTFAQLLAHEHIEVTTPFQTVLERAFTLAKASQSSQILPWHLFTAVVLEPAFIDVLKKMSIDPKHIEAVNIWLTAEFMARQTTHLWDTDYYQAKLGGINRGWLGVPTPKLDAVSTDLTQQALAHRLPEVVDREEAMHQITQVLSRSQRENVLIIGETGSGKTSVVYKVAQQIIQGNVPKSLFSKRLVALATGDLVAQVTSQENIEAKIKAIVSEIEATGNVILFIDDIHTLVSIASPQGTINALALLKPHLASTKFQVIGAASTENYQKYIEPYKDFTALFQIVDLPQVSPKEAEKILAIESQALEKRHNVVIGLPAIEAAVKLSERYIHDKVLPGKAFDLLDEACVFVSSTTPGSIVTALNVEKIVEQKTNVPVHDADKRERDTLLHLEAKIHERMIDQEQAVKSVADALRRERTGVTDEKRPIASFLFVGPTGVGKTELAKSLAAVYFGSEDAMVRFDMSEFQEQLSVYRLIGTPMTQGSGLAQPGQLTEAVRQKPFALLLFDEIEKAHSAILDLFLQILEDGRLTDSSGNLVTFKDTIIIATSNAGTAEIEQAIAQGVSLAQIQQSLLQLLSTKFRIEFLNRFDEIVLFKPLNLSSMAAITELMLKALAKELAEKGYLISFSPGLIQSLAQRGFNPLLGARPLRRLIQENIESQIAKMILTGQLKKGEHVMLNAQYFGQPQEILSPSMMS